jgi:RNA polymerase sigma-70 factor (ECF subfamily)
MTPDEIDALVTRARGGDRAAFRALVLALEPDVRLCVGAFEVSDGLVEELVQATFVSAYQSLAQYKGGGAFRAWLKAIARNHLLRTLREQKRFADGGGDLLEGALVDTALEEIDRMDELERQTRRLRDCVAALPERLRALVERRYMEEASTVRLARELSRSEVWVRVTLCRVRQALRRCMEEAGA